MDYSILSDDKLKSSLLKKALGYDYTEVTEEYSVDDNNVLALVKRKVVTKQVPPDYSAVKVLMDYFNEDQTSKYEKMTDEELELEKQKYINQLKQKEQK